jgi:alcohol dehydrogenase class IV
MTDRPHGECLAVSVRAGLSYNLPVRHDEYGAVARTLLDDGGSDTPPEALIAECERLRDSIGLPGSFDAVGLDRSDVDTIVENTLVQDRRLATNPRTVTEDLRGFLLDGVLSE